jgi:hypothetical protein
MNRDDIIKMARKAGIEAEADTLCRNNGFVEPLECFAALVIASHPPQSFMTWQEGYEAGKQAEREACALTCEGIAADDQSEDSAAQDCAAAIRARGRDD